MGAMCYNGQGIPRDYQEALRWYKMSADKGNTAAQMALGDMYEKGTGVERDLEQAAEWYSKASDKGNVRAYKQLTRLNSKIDRLEQGYPEHIDSPSDIKLGILY